MRITPRAIQLTLQGAWRLMQAMSACSVKILHAPSRFCRDAGVCGHAYDCGHARQKCSPPRRGGDTTTAMHINDPPPPPAGTRKVAASPALLERTMRLPSGLSASAMPRAQPRRLLAMTAIPLPHCRGTTLSLTVALPYLLPHCTYTLSTPPPHT